MSSEASTPNQFTINVSGTEFKLSQTQIESDSPNLFTAAFLEHDFLESITSTVYLDQNPLLFEFIIAYLSGYKITPIQEKGLPQTMSLEMGVENLCKDAEYLGLEKLVRLLRSDGLAKSMMKQSKIFANAVDLTLIRSGEVELELSSKKSKVGVLGTESDAAIIICVRDVTIDVTMNTARPQVPNKPRPQESLLFSLPFRIVSSGEVEYNSTSGGIPLYITDSLSTYVQATALEDRFTQPIAINNISSTIKELIETLKIRAVCREKYWNEPVWQVGALHDAIETGLSRQKFWRSSDVTMTLSLRAVEMYLEVAVIERQIVLKYLAGKFLTASA